MSDESSKMIDLEQLIQIVQEQRLLWDKRHKHYRNRLLTKRAWKFVADSVGCSREEAQAKWKNLRDSFNRELKKITKKRSGAKEVEVYTGDWVHFDSLEFLYGVVRSRKTPTIVRGCKKLLEDADNMDEESAVSIVSNSTGLSSNADNQTHLQSEFQSFPSIQYAENEKTEPNDSFLYPHMLLQKDFPTSEVPVENNNIKQEGCPTMFSDLEKHKFDLFKKEIQFQEDEDMNWFKSILPHMRTLPPLTKFMFRTKVQEMLLEELAKLNSSKPGTSTGQTSQSTSTDSTLNQ